MNKLVIGPLSFFVETLEHASDVYCRIRDELNLGSSVMHEGVAYLADETFYVSYNGKVWSESGVDRRTLSRVCEPVFDPYL